MITSSSSSPTMRGNARPSFKYSLCPQLVMEVLSQLEGASALLFKSSHYSGQMVACRRGSPLIVGIREPKDTKSGSAAQFEAFVASDGAAVVEHTKQ